MRRNLPPAAIGDLKLEEKEIVARQAKERMKAGKPDPTPNLGEGTHSGETLEILARDIPMGRESLRKLDVIKQKAKEDSHRNLIKYDRARLVLELEPLYAAEAKRRMSEGGNSSKVGRQIFDNPQRTDEQLAKLAGTSRDTIRKV